jgi:acetyltransferase
VTAEPGHAAPPPIWLELRNGTRVHLRPLEPGDAGRLADALSRLSPESRRQRFLTAVERLTPQQLAYLTNPDLEDHLALGIETIPDDGSAPVGIGVARCVRLEGDLAEVAVAVADEWQGRGVGTLLFHHLALWARSKGIRRWLGAILADNKVALELMDKVGAVERRRTVSPGVVEVVCRLAED